MFTLTHVCRPCGYICIYTYIYTGALKTTNRNRWLRCYATMHTCVIRMGSICFTQSNQLYNQDGHRCECRCPSPIKSNLSATSDVTTMLYRFVPTFLLAIDAFQVPFFCNIYIHFKHSSKRSCAACDISSNILQNWYNVLYHVTDRGIRYG